MLYERKRSSVLYLQLHALLTQAFRRGFYSDATEEAEAPVSEQLLRCEGRFSSIHFKDKDLHYPLCFMKIPSALIKRFTLRETVLLRAAHWKVIWGNIDGLITLTPAGSFVLKSVTSVSDLLLDLEWKHSSNSRQEIIISFRYNAPEWCRRCSRAETLQEMNTDQDQMKNMFWSQSDWNKNRCRSVLIWACEQNH